MRNKLAIAWATKIDEVQLGARLEAYAESKSAIETFSATAVRLKLPPEILDIIADKVKDDAYVERLGLWLQGRRCCEYRCDERSHFTAQELHDSFGIRCKNEDEFSCKVGDLSGKSDIVHAKIVKTHLARVRRLTRDSITTTQEAFAKDFGLHPCFKRLETKCGAFLECDKISAFLTLPIGSAFFQRQPGPGLSSTSTFISEHELPAMNKEACQSVKTLFKNAVKALRLDAPHTMIMRMQDQVECSCQPSTSNIVNEDSTTNSPERVLKASLEEESASESQFHEPMRQDRETFSKRTRDRKKVSRARGDVNEPFCLECQSSSCQGPGLPIVDPELMVIGHRQLYTCNEKSVLICTGSVSPDAAVVVRVV